MLLKFGSHVTFHNLLGSVGACWAQRFYFSTAANDAQCITKSLVLFCIDRDSYFFRSRMYMYLLFILYDCIQLPEVSSASYQMQILAKSIGTE